MNNKISLKTITPKDLWNVFCGCFWFLLAAVTLVTGVMYARAKYNYSPLYTSKATVYLIGQNENGEFEIDNFAADYTIAMRVMKDCDYIVKSRTVLDEVGKRIGISNGYGALSPRLAVYNPTDTRVLEISVTWSNPEQAQKIVNEICSVGQVEINRVLGYDGLGVFEDASLNRYPINGVSLTSYLKFGIIAALGIYIVFLLMFLFDNYIHTEEDIERYLGLTVIGDIPDADAPKKKGKYGNYSKYGRYRSYRYYKKHGSTRYQDGYVKYGSMNESENGKGGNN